MSAPHRDPAGRATATRLTAFGCTISYHNRHRADVPYHYAESAVELARSVDVLIVAATGGHESRRLIDRGVLDVFTDEPNVPTALFAMANVVLLPHVGSATVQTRAAMEALTLRNLDRFLQTGQLLTPVPESRAAGT